MPHALLEGFQHFRTTDLARYRERYRRLAEEGQQPPVLFVGCSDSRVVPDLLTASGPGDLFVVRTVGAIVGPHETPGEPTQAAAEFAVGALGVRDIVVCGHSQCGAMKALDAGAPDDMPHLQHWLAQVADAALPAEERADLAPAEAAHRLERRAVLLGLERLAANPLVADRRARGQLTLHGWHLDLATQDVEAFDPATSRFRPLEEVLGDAADDAEATADDA